MNKDIILFNNRQSDERQAICNQLSAGIQQALPEAESKIWHGSPVWFLDDNPIVGYAALKQCVQLLFWSGQSFNEPGLQPEGSFKAAEKRFTSKDEISSEDLRRWLAKARAIQWNYKDIVKRRGLLERINKEKQ